MNPLEQDLSLASTEQRMQHYAGHAFPLGKQAVSDALAQADVDSSDVGLFAVTSCTGYSSPGLDIQLAAALRMPPTARRLQVGHMGCYAALPSLATVTDYVLARGQPAVLLCVELTSLHIQPATRDAGQVVAHALFSDGAAAAVVRPDVRDGLRLVDFATVTEPAGSEHMTWDVTDLGFRMGLSPKVPDLLAPHVRPVIGELLSRHGLDVDDVSAWAVHPGGPRILDTVERELALGSDALATSRQVLAEHGNCSSATVLMILERLAANRAVPPGGTAVMMAFGPGLTLSAALLRG